MTRYDPHPQAHDDARSTPSGFTDRRESDENGSGVPQPLTREAADGLRGALEALADGFADTWAQRRADADREPPGTTQQHVDVAAGQAWWVAERNLRAVLAAHPADAPAEGRSGSGAARVVPVEVLEELAERWRRKQVGAQRSAMAAIEFTKSFDPVLDLWAVITAHATTVDPETTRSGFTGATESDERAVSVSVDADAGERRTEAQGTPWGPSWHAMNATPGDSAGAESVSAVEQAARVLHAWDVEDGPCAGPWEALTDAQREVWRSGAQALADHGLLVPDDYPSNPEGSWRPRAERAEAEARAAQQEADRLRDERDRARATAVALEQENALAEEQARHLADACDRHERYAADQDVELGVRGRKIDRLQRRLRKAEKRAEQESRAAGNAAERVIHLRTRNEELERRVADLEAEVDQMRSRALGDEQCCVDTCNGGACETCPGCAAGWCVNGHDFAADPDVWEQMMSDEDRQQWFDVAREHNRGIDAALSERDRARARVAELEAENWDLVKERDRAIVEQARARHLAAALEDDNARLTEHKRQMGIELSESVPRYQLDAAEALAARNATTAGVLTADLRRTTRAAGAAEARARRAEDALRELTEAASRLCVAVDIHPERLRPTLRREADKCRQALDWARAALSAADQTSDATPSDTTTEGA